jgi:hypothetical protein
MNPLKTEHALDRSETAYNEWKAWVWHRPNCRVAGIGEHLHPSCTCGLAEKLAAIHQPDPAAIGERE